MENFEFIQSPDLSFIGRKKELDWLASHTYRYSQRPIFVTGPAGIGKTVLVKRFLFESEFGFEETKWTQRYRGYFFPKWVDLHSQSDPMNILDQFHEQFKFENEKRYRGDSEMFIVIDGAEILSDRQIEDTSRRILNWKVVRSLIYITRRNPDPKNDETLVLEKIPTIDATRLLSALSPYELPAEIIEQAILSTRGNPYAISLLASLLKTNGTSLLADIVAGRHYDFSKIIAVPSREIIASIRPAIVTTNEALVAELKKCPKAVYDLHPRKFEEVVAELLSDMGCEVHVTKQTRDGGKDILAYLNTSLGKILCLVEAKRHRPDRKVGIGLVRTLYGTLCDHQATSAMLVTTSTFSSDARQFQKKHQYELELREYGDVVQWIQQYKNVK